MGALLPTFSKVNFDGNVISGYDGAGFVIRNPDSRFIMTDRSRFFEIIVLEAELQAT